MARGWPVRDRGRAVPSPAVGAVGAVGAVWQAAAMAARGPSADDVLGRVTLVTGKEEFLSERTVASHLTHVYAKLGVRSRTELARKLG